MIGNIFIFHCLFDLYLISGDCTEEFISFNGLYSHVILVHPDDTPTKYTCPYCHTKMKCKTSELKEHFAIHTDLHLEEFQCLYCENGFKDIDTISKHMSKQHPANFLFIGARNKVHSILLDDDEEVQIVYIGDSCDFSQYTFVKCPNQSLLESMDPNELNPNKLIAHLNSIQTQTITEPFTESISPILFSNESTFQKKCINLEQYNEFVARKHKVNRIPAFGSNSTTQSTPSSSPSTSISAPTKRIITNHQSNLPSTSSNPLNIFPSTSKLQHQPRFDGTIKYLCISVKAAKDLCTIYGRYKSRACAECFTFMKIDDQSGLKWYLTHLTDQHQCAIRNEFDDLQEMYNHRIKYHGKDPIVYLQTEKSTYTVHKIVQCKFECQICESKFDTHHQLADHTSKTHNDHFLEAQIEQHSTVIESNDLHQPIKSESITVEYFFCIAFKCLKDDRIFLTKSEILDHHNQYHHGTYFEAKMRKFIINLKNDKSKIKNYEHENKRFLRLYVFKCEKCCKLYDSIDSVNNHGCEPEFTISKLVACYERQQSTNKPILVVRTFIDMQTLYENDHSLHFAPVDIISSQKCGLCNYQFENIIDLKNHYQRLHLHGDSLDDDVLDAFFNHSITNERLSLGQCRYGSKCCDLTTHILDKTIDRIIAHLNKCKRRFKCRYCPTNDSIDNFLAYKTHLQQHTEIRRNDISSISDIKKLLELMSNILIIRFPNGLNSNMAGVSNTYFVNELLRPKLMLGLQKFIKQERLYFA